MLPEQAFQPRNGRLGMTLEGGGGGGTTQSTVTQTNIPDWLRPQTEALIGSATQEYFQTTPTTTTDPVTGETKTTQQITGIKPFTPYSTRPEDYSAGFSPIQQQMQREAAGMQRPGQFGAGSQLVGAAGSGAFGTTGQALGYGGMGAGLGMEAAGAGQRYQQMATDPRAMQSYMSPYMQNVVDTQKQAAIRDYQEQIMPQIQAQATRVGAFGGSRDAIQRGIAQRGLASQLQGIQATGSQKAFEEAQRAQQFGSTLGLQGLQAGMQGAQVGLQGVQGAQAGYGMAGQMGRSLADIGSQQQAADLSRMQFQGNVGAQQQALEQQRINQAIQNFQAAREHPYEQLSRYSGLLRGYYTPTRTETTNLPGYNPMAQFLGTGMQAYGFGKMAGAFKEGGSVKEKKYDEGGIASISQKVMNDPKSYSREMINKGINSGSISKMAGAIGLSELENAEQQAQQQKNLATPAPQGTILGDLQQRASAGIDQLPSNLPVQRAASGGIIAFEDGGDVNEPIRFQNEGLVDMVRQQQMEDPNYRDPQDIEELIAAARRRREGLGKDKNIEAYEKYMEGLPAELSKSRDMSKAMAIASMGSKIAQTRGRAIPAISAGLEAGIPMLAAGEKEYRAGMGELMRGRAQLGQAARAEAIRGIEAGEAEARSLRDLASRKEIANLDRDARKYATDNPSILVTARSIMKPGESLSDAVKRVYGMQQTPEKYQGQLIAALSSARQSGSTLFQDQLKDARSDIYFLNKVASGDSSLLKTEDFKRRYPNVKTTQEAKDKLAAERRRYIDAEVQTLEDLMPGMFKSARGGSGSTKIMTEADVKATAASSGRTEAEVRKAAIDQGYTIR
jgi:hypothetical protein